MASAATTATSSPAHTTPSLCSPASLAAIASLHQNGTRVEEPKQWQREAQSHTPKQRVVLLPTKRQPHAHVLMQYYKSIYVTIRGEFLVPPHYVGHTHDWVQLDAGLCVCKVCGAEHICFQGECPMVQMEQSEMVCSISGCVIVLSELKAEWGALERVHSPGAPPMGSGTRKRKCKDDDEQEGDPLRTTNDNNNSKKRLRKNNSSRTGMMMMMMHHQRQAKEVEDNHKNNKPQPKKKKGLLLLPQHHASEPSGVAVVERNAHLKPSNHAETSHALLSHHQHAATVFSPLHTKRTSTIHDTVEMVVRELLDSPKTARCLEEERARDYARRHSYLAKLIRELIANQHTCKERPNMVLLETKLSWHCHKCRRTSILPTEPLPLMRARVPHQQHQVFCLVWLLLLLFAVLCVCVW